MLNRLSLDHLRLRLIALVKTVQGVKHLKCMTGSDGGGGGGVTINVNGGDPNAVVNALRTYMRQNGSIPIKVSNNY